MLQLMLLRSRQPDCLLQNNKKSVAVVSTTPAFVYTNQRDEERNRLQVHQYTATHEGTDNKQQE